MTFLELPNRVGVASLNGDDNNPLLASKTIILDEQAASDYRLIMFLHRALYQPHALYGTQCFILAISRLSSYLMLAD
jgi:hypothetical protein